MTTTKSTVAIVNLSSALKSKHYRKAFQIYLDFEKSILTTLINHEKIIDNIETETINPLPLIICYTLFKLAIQNEGDISQHITYEKKENINDLKAFLKQTNEIDQIVGSSRVTDLLSNLIFCAIQEFENENMNEIDLRAKIENVHECLEQFLSSLERTHLYTPNSICAQLIYLAYLLCKRMNELLKGCLNMKIMTNSQIEELQNTFQNNLNQIDNHNKFCLQQLHDHYQWQIKNSQDIFENNITEIYKKTQESKNDLWEKVNLSQIDIIHDKELQLNEKLIMLDNFIKEFDTARTIVDYYTLTTPLDISITSPSLDISNNESFNTSSE
ncbi:hypothetical protein TCON_1620 [Astathelohania contejeani]|uniref:Uncharacterized protein n=1 Tax=Astathelohania contejeani TaxID=164912 RepID=A0ABQ7HYC2_9MICR|nr:hypothetical protein TCON_1620 [Thelohania contejeani]